LIQGKDNNVYGYLTILNNKENWYFTKCDNWQKIHAINLIEFGLSCFLDGTGSKR